MMADLNALPLTEGGGGSRYKLPGPGGPEGAQGPSILQTSISQFINQRLCTALCSSPFANESQPFRFSVKTFSRSALAGGPEKMLSLVLEPALGSHVCMACKFT